MELFIRIVDGQPFEHPIFGDNFRQAFPNVDVNNLPSNFARFERVNKPNTCKTFEVEECSYQLVDGVVKDVWTARAMTEQEHAKKNQDLTDSANATIAMFKQIAQLNINIVTNQNAKQTWEEYAAQLNAWELVDPANPNIPSPPRLDANGNLLTTNSSGSAPNVIG